MFFFSNLILGFKREKSTVFIYYFFLPHQKKDDGWHFSRFTLICFICNTQHVCVRIFFLFHSQLFTGFFPHTKKKQIQLVNHWLFHSLEIGRNCYKLFTLNNSFATSSRHEIYALHTMELHIVVSSLSHVPFFIFIYW